MRSRVSLITFIAFNRALCSCLSRSIELVSFDDELSQELSREVDSSASCQLHTSSRASAFDRRAAKIDSTRK